MVIHQTELDAVAAGGTYQGAELGTGVAGNDGEDGLGGTVRTFSGLSASRISSNAVIGSAGGMRRKNLRTRAINMRSF